MAFLEEAADSPERAAVYAADQDHQGYVANYTRVFSHRPDVYDAWKALNAAVKANLSLERYEVATIAAAQQRGSDYCALAHGRVLSRALDVETVIKIGNGSDEDAERQAISTLARKVAANPAQVTAADLAPLRDRGFSDADILDVVLTSAIRCFFSTVLSATGAEPDPALLDQEASLKDALMAPPGSPH
jgi:uncharacterized peroxidase-related enzyme